MLTKDLLRYQTLKDQIRPSFVIPNDPSLLYAAQQFIEVFEDSVGKTRQFLLDRSKEIIDSDPSEGVILRGLEKLLIDRTEFDTTTDTDLLEFRQKLFLQTTKLLATQQFVDIRAYHEQLEALMKTPHEVMATKLYSDLPPYQLVTEFKPITPEKLLHRYNCAQVQGLLLRSDQLVVKLLHSDLAQIRQLFKYLKFHQLLANIQKDDNHFSIQIDGPLSLFFQTQKYGINLANFFPALLHQPVWELRAVVHLTKVKKYQLLLNQTFEIQSHYQHYLAYIPEEIEVFQNHFQNKAKGWTIQAAQEFLHLEGEQYCFPDYKLTHPESQGVYLELFHGWHATHLVLRLKQLEKSAKYPLLVGVNKSLLKDSLVAECLENSHYFSQYGFVFRDMPTTEKVLPLLESFYDQLI